MSSQTLFSLPHICFIGSPNSGKSTLFNLLLEKEVAITSSVRGTTTDPIFQTSEIIGYGKVRLIDTAGISDKTSLEKQRNKKTLEALEKANLVFFVIDITVQNIEKEIKQAQLFCSKLRQKSVILLNKKDLVNDNKNYEGSFVLSTDLLEKRNQLIDLIKTYLPQKTEDNLLSGINLQHNSILVVIPFDGEAPTGRLILPQNKLIHDALINNIYTYVININTLKDFLEFNHNPLDLVITDSKIFSEVSKIIPPDLPLTSFSVLYARAKGDLLSFYSAIKVFEKMKTMKTAHILIQEVCTHTKNHEDIGTKMIPSLIKKHIGEHVQITFDNQGSLNENHNYDLIIHCGACMISKSQMLERISKADNSKTPITNYGMVLAYFAGILERAITPLT